MNRQTLAEKLVSAKSEKERKTLLRENNKQADARLAVALKEICYAAWTNKPTKAQKTAQAIKTLVKFNPDKEIEAYSFWISGIADLTRGKLASTIENLNKSAEFFEKIGKEHEAAKTQVAKLYALALLGKYDDAVESGKKTLEIFEKYGDELSAGKVEKNLGNIVARQDGILKAEKYYLSAIKRFTKINDLEELTMCKVNLADNYADLHNFRQAENYYAQALKPARKANMTFVEAEIEASLGNLAIFRGKYSEALRHLETARQKFEHLNIKYRSIIAELEIADIYFELNLSDEAFEIYGTVIKKLHDLKMQGEEAKARANFGKVAVTKNEFSAARKELKKSAKLYILEKNSSGAADVKLSQANLEFLLGNYENALKAISEANKLLKKSQNLRLKLQVQFLYGEILRKLKQHKKSAELLSETYKKSVNHEQLNLAQICLNSLGSLALQKGETRKAESYFKQSVKMIENLRAPLPAEEFRMAFLADKFAPFENLAKLYIRQNEIEKSFIYTEKARSRTLSENMQKVADVQPESNAHNSKLAEKLKDSREELNWFYSHLKRADETEIENLQTEIKKREKQISKLMRQIESTRPPKTEFEQIRENKHEISLRDLQEQLGNRKLLIEFVKFGNVFSAFIISENKIDFVSNLADENEIFALIEGLQFQFGALRYGEKLLNKFASELKKRADFYLQKLYEKLLKPLEDFIENRSLVIVPVSSLHYVPFHALYNGKNYVIENQEVSVAPSATVWKTLHEKPLKNITNALLIGFADEKTPLVNSEIKEIKKMFNNAKILTGEDATFSNYAANAEDFDILHIACHGQFRPDNPLFSSLHLANGFVTVRDIYSQKLSAELVTLSACETGLSKIFAGDEILGLARGFLTAGVSSIVLSLWTVNDKAATRLMKDFYTELQLGNTVSASLRKAQLNFIKKKEHTYFWSPFTVIGR